MHAAVLNSLSSFSDKENC